MVDAWSGPRQLARHGLALMQLHVGVITAVFNDRVGHPHLLVVLKSLLKTQTTIRRPPPSLNPTLQTLIFLQAGPSLK